MSADTCRQIAFSTPKNGELVAAREADRSARERAEKKAVVFAAMLAALKGVVAVADRKSVEFDAARAAIALAEEVTP